MGENKKVAALVLGTAALHLAIIACDVKPDNEAMIQSFTFCASINPNRLPWINSGFRRLGTRDLELYPVLLDNAIADHIKETDKKLKPLSQSHPMEFRIRLRVFFA